MNDLLPLQTQSCGGISTGDSLRVECFASFTGAEMSPQAWDEAVERLEGSIYFTYDWLRTWWESYGTGCQLRLFLFWAGDQVAGLLPMYVDRIGFAPFRISVSRLVGANIPGKPFQLPLDAKYARQARDLMLNYLFQADDCDLVSLGPVAVDSEASRLVVDKAGLNFSRAHFKKGRPSVHSRFLLPSNPREYLNSLGSSERKRREYELRLLKRNHQIRVETVPAGDSVLAEFEEFAEQHSLQWRAEGLPGHFGAWPGALAYNRKLVARQAKWGRVRFVRVWADNEVIARHYIFSFGARWFWELPSRAIDQRWGRISLGSVAAVCMIEQAIQEGVSIIEAGLGEYQYKRRLKAGEFPVETARFVNPRRRSRIKKAGFGLFQKALLVGYHKTFYRRILPRLPFCFGRSQWKLWLRLDY